jgi:hypothetical protein
VLAVVVFGAMGGRSNSDREAKPTRAQRRAQPKKEAAEREWVAREYEAKSRDLRDQARYVQEEGRGAETADERAALRQEVSELRNDAEWHQDRAGEIRRGKADPEPL